MREICATGKTAVISSLNEAFKVNQEACQRGILQATVLARAQEHFRDQRGGRFNKTPHRRTKRRRYVFRTSPRPKNGCRILAGSQLCSIFCGQSLFTLSVYKSPKQSLPSRIERKTSVEEVQLPPKERIVQNIYISSVLT